MKRTNRGFAIYLDFKDERGNEVRVQRSSVVERRRVWLFIDEAVPEGTIKRDNAGTHLSPKDARRVAKALERFAKGEE